MCGGIAMASSPGPMDRISYHLGRLIGYATLGFVAGYLGQSLLETNSHFWGGIAATGLGLGYILLGISAWQGAPLRLFELPPAITGRLRKMGRHSSAATGLLTAFLPCGWLHVFLLGAIATESPWKGSIYLILFWAGTVPILNWAPLILTKILSPLTLNFPRLAAIVLIVIGGLSIGMHLYPENTEVCGHHHTVSSAH